MSEHDYTFLTRDIIGKKPRWIVRWGITSIFVILVTIGITLSLIRYPVSSHLPAHIEYDRKPVPLNAPGNAILTRIDHSLAGSFVKKGDVLMVLENNSDHSISNITAPVDGKIYLSEKFLANSFISQQQVLGYIVPQPNEQIIKLNLAKRQFGKLRTGQRVIVKISDLPTPLTDLQGTVDFISPAFATDSHTVTIRFPAAVNERLVADSTLNMMQKIPCNATITQDTVSYLSYIFRRSKF